MASPRTLAKRPVSKSPRRDSKNSSTGPEKEPAADTPSSSKLKIPELLVQLEEAAKILDVRVTYEAMSGELGSGGLCKVKGQWRVIIDKRATPGDRVSILALALSRVPREGVSLHPAVEKLLGEVKPRAVSLEDPLVESEGTADAGSTADAG